MLTNEFGFKLRAGSTSFDPTLLLLNDVNFAVSVKKLWYFRRMLSRDDAHQMKNVRLFSGLMYTLRRIIKHISRIWGRRLPDFKLKVNTKSGGE